MRERKPKKPRRSMTAITLWLAGAMLLAWGASVYCVTMATARMMYDKLYQESWEFIDYAQSLGGFSLYYERGYSHYGLQNEYSDQIECGMLQAIDGAGSYSTGTITGYLNSHFPLRDLSIPIDAAVIFYDKDGTILHESGNVMYFQYATQETWDAGEEGNPELQRFGWIDLDEEGENALYSELKNTGRLGGRRILRITGAIDGSQIKPLSMYSISAEQLDQRQKWLEEWTEPEKQMLEDGSFYFSYRFLYSDLDRAGYLDWQLEFDHTAVLESTDGQVTIYALEPRMALYEGSSLSLLREQYDSLHFQTKETADHMTWWEKTVDDLELMNMSTYSLGQICHFNSRAYRDWSQYSGAEEEKLPEPDFIMVTVIRSHPLQTAVSALRNVYFGTFLLAVALVLLVRGAVKKHLVVPIGDINNGIEEDWKLIYNFQADNCPAVWREADDLYKHYCAQRDWRRYAQNELTRLTAALNYAKKSEQNRRQLTSSITHELKTPLAIIHSYSEGLKEHIAEDKREQYLDVILSEAEHMDSMVLEMLDLSRLEAGKVKLARDEFSLSALVRSIFDKLDALAREKNLTVTLELDGDCIVTADEARIGQVITNFASNAIHYTPEGGTVLVKTWSRNGETGFSVENTSKPFTGEELAKVWDTFYQTDKSRGGKGTGLGLAIAKNIIELHRGICSVQNTETGVEFGFTL